MTTTSTKMERLGQAPHLARAADSRSLSSASRWLLFILAHLPLAFFMHQSAAVATGHAIVTLLIGLGWALSQRSVDKVVMVAGYLISAEGLWRMTRAGIFWEFGKYAICAILLVALFRHRRTSLPVAPLLYFLLLLPAAAITWGKLSLGAARSEVSFALSGPFTLLVSYWFFSSFSLSRRQLHRLFLVSVGPMIAIVTIIILVINATPALSFGRSSNPALSGGFGPNQVSNTLALGALLAFLLLVDPATQRKGRGILLVLIVTLASTSALTFSRGGLYSAAGAALVASLILVRARQTRITVILAVVLLFGMTSYLVLPRLDAFTQGALTERFDNTSPTGRDLILRGDLVAWRENFISGTGPGLSGPYHAIYFRESSAHVEFSRMVAEHGLLGFISLLILLGMTISNLLKFRRPEEQAWRAALLVFALLFMGQAAMRLAMPAFLIGLTAVRLSEREDAEV